ncbi:uncharacterized protein LOC112466071 [Temnothorax curvispinosus]|uniref:Uncharacterized protein LOC112466071 n=1 Tax=Temnothorax curvispinosus TaxID=300111 RepID=A0A6J1R6A0_9HYME|nr:uncharacterized protein LOC112466071 [Temnothorax curvispinosus]
MAYTSIPKVLQANLNRCRAAQDLFLQSMAKRGSGLGIVAEPYRVPNNHPCWASSRCGLAAVTWRQTACPEPCTKLVAGEGYVAVKWGQVVVISAYVSPNRSRAEFWDILNQIGMCLTRFGPAPIVVAGDLNAKSALWGSPVTNAWGSEVEDWMAKRNLLSLNRGNRWTCIRPNGGSIVDITMVNPEGLRRAGGWGVVEDVETRSDHEYVEFSLMATPRETVERRRAAREKFLRWQWRKADRDLFRAATLTALWEDNVLRNAANSVEDQAERIGAIMRQACDAAMPRSNPIPRKGMYW